MWCCFLPCAQKLPSALLDTKAAAYSSMLARQEVCPTSGTMCTSASAVMTPPLNARSSRGTTVLVLLNQRVIKLHMEAAKMTNSPATLQHDSTQVQTAVSQLPADV